MWVDFKLITQDKTSSSQNRLLTSKIVDHSAHDHSS